MTPDPAVWIIQDLIRLTARLPHAPIPLHLFPQLETVRDRIDRIIQGEREARAALHTDPGPRGAGVEEEEDALQGLGAASTTSRASSPIPPTDTFGSSGGTDIGAVDLSGAPAGEEEGARERRREELTESARRVVSKVAVALGYGQIDLPVAEALVEAGWTPPPGKERGEGDAWRTTVGREWDRMVLVRWPDERERLPDADFEMSWGGTLRPLSRKARVIVSTGLRSRDRDR